MKFFGAFLLVCGLFAFSHALPHPKDVAESESDDEKRFIPALVQVQQIVSGVCKSVYDNLPDLFKRACTCVGVFDGGFGDEEMVKRSAVDDKRFFIPGIDLIKIFTDQITNAVNGACQNPEPDAAKVCDCLTGILQLG